MRKALILLALLSACGPVTQQQAEADCFARARGATGPHGKVGVGVGSNGPEADLELSVSSDYLQGRDPAAVYDACVYQKTGQPPSQPLYARPDWRG